MKLNEKKIDMQKVLAPAALVILYVFFSVVGDGFLSMTVFKNILESSYYIGFMAFGVTFIIITGGIDLSLGTVMMCAALLGAYTFKQLHFPLIVSLLVAVLVGAVFGFLNGVMVAKLKLPPFIATLGTMMMSQGFGSIITKVQSQTWPTATEPVGGWFKKVFIRADLFGVKGFPVGVFWLIGFFVIAALILHKTKFGRYVFAIGSNEEAARLSGINVDNWKIAVYTLSGIFVGLSGIMYAAAYTTITPGTGNGQEMNGITGVVIGGTSMSGGSGTMVGTLIGVFIMSVLKTGLSNLNLQAPWQTFFTGLVVIGAVLLDIQRTKAANRVKKS
ncbi:MAG: ABC transporter permease [Lawsonibacter sp.]|jgi:ribose transport system permease protein|nr:ABC transporter permease [Lawsonibacter sp.]MCI9670518.1 ABC transporter permease [Lawsonibacter sp.]